MGNLEHEKRGIADPLNLPVELAQVCVARLGPVASIGERLLERLTSTNHYLISLLRVLDENDLEASYLLDKAGLEGALLLEPNQRVNTKKLADFVWLVANELQDETLGQGALPSRPGTFFTIGELAVHQPNLLDAFKRGIRFHHQVTEDYTLELLVDGQTATFVVNQPRLDLDPSHLLTELILLAWHRLCSWLIGDNINLSSVTFVYPPPPHEDEYKYLFRCPRKFNQTITGFSFRAAYLEKPVMQDIGKLKTFMRNCPFNLFMYPHSDSSAATRVQRLMQKNIDKGVLSLAEISQELGMSNRTLRRKLTKEGTSFQAIKDTIRRDMAIYYLVQKSLSVNEIACQLGFSEPGVFVRAFKKWTGSTPGVYKKHSA